MRTWGYVKNASLAKLDLDASDSVTSELTNRFYIYANEAMTQICSAIKPKESVVKIEINDCEDIGKTFSMSTLNTYTNRNNFIAFGRGVSLWHSVCNEDIYYEVHDNDVLFSGYDEITFLHKGTYYISVIERWFNLAANTAENTELNAPDDILDCLPSYIASQCYKVDDEVKAAIYRNEYEMFLARINTDSKINTKTFTIGGDW